MSEFSSSRGPESGWSRAQAYHEMKGLTQHELDAKFFANGAIAELTGMLQEVAGQLPEKTRQGVERLLEDLRRLEAELKSQNPQRDTELITYKVLRAVRIMTSLRGLSVEQLPGEREHLIKEIEDELVVN